MKFTKAGITDSVIVVIIFSLTGITTLFVSSFITNGLGLEKWSLLYWVVFIFLILPVYHLLLFGYAFLFGKFNYFRDWIQKIRNRISSGIFKKL